MNHTSRTLKAEENLSKAGANAIPARADGTRPLANPVQMTSADYPLPIAQLFPVQIFGIVSPDKVGVAGAESATWRRKTSTLQHSFASGSGYASSSLYGQTAGRAASSKGQQEASNPGHRSPVGKCCMLQNPAGAGDANAMRALLALTGSCQTCLLSAPKHIPRRRCTRVATTLL